MGLCGSFALPGPTDGRLGKEGLRPDLNRSQRRKRSKPMGSNLRFVWAGRAWGRGGNLVFTMAPTRGPKRQSKGGVLKALCVHAHFDDFEFVAAGTFELWRRRVRRGFEGRGIGLAGGEAGDHLLPAGGT